MPNDTSNHDAVSNPMLLSAVQVAGLLGVSRAHIWRLHSAGQLPAPLRLGRAVRWRRSELEDWLAAGAPNRDRWRTSEQGTR
ncbi:MAG: helix-turn-helix domain-containing protein [Phycisphaeraceae bacterium]|nr:helix-turn-helix domain-containing protein [Phycisphaeraceae bacterium]